MAPSSIPLRHHPSTTRRPSLNSNSNDYGSRSSPYYKGLTDQSIALYEKTSCPAYPYTQTTTHTRVSTPSSSGGESSPYYAGLTDNSLALYGQSDSSPFAVVKNLRFWLRKDVHGKKSAILGWSSSSGRPKSGKIMTEIYGKKVKRREHVEEKRVWERVLEEPYKVDAKVLEEMTEKEEVGGNILVGKKKSMTESVRVWENRDVSESNKDDPKLFKEITEKGEDSENILVGKKKSMRESVRVWENRDVSESNKVNAKLFKEITEKGKVRENILVGKKEKSMKESVGVWENRDVSESNKVNARLSEEIAEKEEVSENILVGKKEKSLRERVCDKRSGVPESSESLSNDGKEIIAETLKMATEKGKEKEYVWASKYQPKALDDFVCNRDIAIQLQTLVRLNSLLINPY